MKVREIMNTDVISVSKNVNLRDVLNLMEQHNITKIPVLDGDKLLGIVSDGKIADKLGREHNSHLATASLHASSFMERDFLRAHPDQDVKELMEDVGKPGLTMVPVCQGEKLLGVITKADLLKFVKSEAAVDTFMHKQVLSVGTSDRLVHARRILLDNDIARLPVLDHGAVRGILSEHEIALAFATMKEADTHVQKSGVRDLQVGDHMRAKVVKIRSGATAISAAKMMMDEHVGALPVVDEHNQIMGIITRTDLIKTCT